MVSRQRLWSNLWHFNSALHVSYSEGGRGGGGNGPRQVYLCTSTNKVQVQGHLARLRPGKSWMLLLQIKYSWTREGKRLFPVRKQRTGWGAVWMFCPFACLRRFEWWRTGSGGLFLCSICLNTSHTMDCSCGDGSMWNFDTAMESTRDPHCCDRGEVRRKEGHIYRATIQHFNCKNPFATSAGHKLSDLSSVCSSNRSTVPESHY